MIHAGIVAPKRWEEADAPDYREGGPYPLFSTLRFS
jgi:hypothetical protein